MKYNKTMLVKHYHRDMASSFIAGLVIGIAALIMYILI